ncbi:hypothetical protein BDD12DRAFT_808455 [Trichophaea hybrida]|nr:hypothetical protein BDD12DRAFT_808455 [Trichophaea hybrida]
MWNWNTSTGNGKQVMVAGGQLNFGSRRKAWCASELTSKKSFYIGGGGIIGGEIWRLDKGRLVWDTRDPCHLIWANQTMSTADGDTTSHVADTKIDAIIVGSAHQRMEEISVYVIQSSAWQAQCFDLTIRTLKIFGLMYTVAATGDIPPGQALVCTDVFSTPDSSAFQVYMYAGLHYNKTAEVSNSSSSDMYILTVLSFRWIKVTTKHNIGAEFASGAGRFLTQCLSWHKRMMFVIGRHVILRPGDWLVNNHCNMPFPPIRMCDTSELAWVTQYNFSSAKKPMLNDFSVYGHATYKSPEGRWKNNPLWVIFSQTVPTSTAIAATPKPTDTGHSPSSTTISKIAGGVIGGVPGVLPVVGLVVWFRQRPTLPMELPSDNLQLELQASSQPDAEQHGNST